MKKYFVIKAVESNCFYNEESDNFDDFCYATKWDNRLSCEYRIGKASSKNPITVLIVYDNK